MTVRELIELLEQYDDDLDVRIAEQPNYPFEYSVAGVVSGSEAGVANDEMSDAEPDPTKPDDAVFILEGTQLRYASKALWDGDGTPSF